MKLTSIITVNYHQPVVTRDFLISVKKFAAQCPVEVILVDNCPAEDGEAFYQDTYPSVIYIKSDRNLGFAGGNNLGVKHANGYYILMLNNDTEITERFMERMVAEMEKNPDIGLLSPLIKYFDDKSVIQYAGFTPMNYLTARNKAIGYQEKDLGQYYKDSRETGFCHGAAMMCRHEDLLTAGLMDESYFLYYEELDWCEKFRRIGKKIWFTGSALIYHKESLSVGKESGLKTYFVTRNRLLYIRRNTSWPTRTGFCLYYSLLVMPVKIVTYLAQGKPQLAKSAMQGLLWNYFHSRESKNTGYIIK